MALPSDADAAHIQGEFKDGVLVVRVAKKDGVGPKVVSVKVV